MKTFDLVISTPSGKAFNGEATYLSLKGTEGELGILSGHIPLVTAVVEGKCNITLPDGSIIYGNISEGLLTVTESSVTLLVTKFTK